MFRLLSARKLYNANSYFTITDNLKKFKYINIRPRDILK